MSTRMFRTRKALMAVAFGSILIATYGVLSVQAVPGVGVFELDADAAGALPATAAFTQNGSSGLPDDWDRVSTGTANTPTSQQTFITDGTQGGNASIYTGGGSKDGIDIPSWKWKDASGGLPDKDNLNHAFSVRYSIATPTSNCPGLGISSPFCELLYFGADRFDNSGDAQIGFWFFRGPVTANPVTGTFTGVHTAGTVPHSASTPGDILVLSDFTQGGTQPTVRVFEWVGTGFPTSTDGTLNRIAGGLLDPADCATVPDDNGFCAAVNPTDGSTSPWTFLNKSGQSTFGHGEFYEGGLNLNTLGLQNECFSSVLAETRSSQSVTATLKDFVLGSFQICGATAVTTPSAGAGGTVTPGTSVTDTDVITGAGPSIPPFPSSPPNVTFSMCGPIASGVCDSSDIAHTPTVFGVTKALSPTGTQGVSQATSDAVNTPGSPLTPGRYCFKAVWTGDSNYPAGASDYGSGDSECFNVSQLPTTTVTTPSDESGTALVSPVDLGTVLYDKAVVTGATAGGNPPGTVDFFLCDPTEVTGGAGSEVCASGGTDLSGNPRTLSPIALSSPPASKALSSPGVAANLAGTWCFRAEYTPTGPVYTGSSDATHGECVVVSKAPTTTVTTPSETGPIAVNDQVTDHAVVTGSSGDGTPTGTINFFICSPSQLTGGVCASGGTAAGSKTAAAGPGSSPPQSQATSDLITANVVGTWCFRAEYVPGGDNGGNYTGSSDATSGECFTVRDSTSATSAQNWLPNDSATITSLGATALNGTLSFTLYSDDNCGATSGSILIPAETYTLTSAASPVTRSTTNVTYKVSASATVSWYVVFQSSDSNVDGITKCETSTVTIDNDP